MCPTDTEFSTFNVRRTHYLKNRDERLQKLRPRNTEQDQRQQPLPFTRPDPGQ